MTKKFFIDTEFLEGTQKRRLFGIPLWDTKPTIDLISIAIVTEKSDYGSTAKLYLLSKEFNIKEAWYRWQQRTGEGDRNNIEPREYWLRENVLKLIHDDLSFREDKAITPLPFTLNNFKYLVNKYGSTNKDIAKKIIQYMLDVYFWPPDQADGATKHWNAPFFKQILKHSPMEFIGYYSDYDWVVFCWVFGKMIDLPNGFPYYCTDLKQMFEAAMDETELWHKNAGHHDITREFLVKSAKMHPMYPRNNNEHNALSDAIWNRDLYKYIKSIKN